MKPSYDSSSSDSSLAYDLRQRYANLVAVHLEKISTARFDYNYTEYFRGLENLYTIVAHKIKENKKETESYNDLRKKFVAIASKYKEAYLGNVKNPEHISKIEESLREMERYLFRVMDKANMFGSMRDDSGL